MRIRKAEKLLGWAAKYRAAWLPQQPSDSATGFPRELKPSSQVEDTNCCRREDLEAANETSDIGVIGNGFQPKEKEEEEEDDDDNEKEELEDKAEDKKTEVTGVMQCKKTDGKRWHSRRPAKLPHSLCSYHLSQLRSYRARFEHQVSGDHRKKPFLRWIAAEPPPITTTIIPSWVRGGVSVEAPLMAMKVAKLASTWIRQDSNGKTDREGVEETDEKEDGAVSFS